jgi:hypothetical protein
MAQHASSGEPTDFDEDCSSTVDGNPPSFPRNRVEARASLPARCDQRDHAADADDRAALPIDVPPVREDVLVHREPAS